MAKFTLMQILVPDSQYDAVNEMGWSEAMKQFPRVEAQMAMRMGGSDALSSTYYPFYEKVAIIEADSLENAFFVHNNPFGSEELEERIERFLPQHSMSVGDVLIDEHGCAHVVDNVGFTQDLSWQGVAA